VVPSSSFSILIPLLAAVAGSMPPAAAQRSVTVFAAASLTESFTQLGEDFEAAHPDVAVRFNFAGSQILVHQIEQGAHADVFASADQRWMEYAAGHGLLAGAARVFARNRLVVVVPKSNPGNVTRLEDLARPGLRVILAGPQVPVGAYSRAALRSLGPALEARALANLVSEEENVKAVVAKVELGEADAGIAYVTDVTATRPRLALVELPDSANVIAGYPIAPVAGGNRGLAEAFITAVLSTGGQARLRRWGFAAPTGAGP
jgi:molybdate transport system substrate-binding protein